MNLQKLIKMVTKVLSIYPKKYNLLIMQDLWQVHYQIFLIISRKEFIRLNVDCFLEYENLKDNLIKYKCLSYNKDYSNKFDEKLIKKFKKTFKFSNDDFNKWFCC